MTATPGSARHLDPATSRETERRNQFLSPRIIQREAAKVLSARGLEVRPAALRRLVTRFVEHGHTSLAEVEPFFLGYLDPTGETAVRNVLRGGGVDDVA